MSKKPIKTSSSFRVFNFTLVKQILVPVKKKSQNKIWHRCKVSKSNYVQHRNVKTWHILNFKFETDSGWMHRKISSAIYNHYYITNFNFQIAKLSPSSNYIFSWELSWLYYQPDPASQSPTRPPCKVSIWIDMTMLLRAKLFLLVRWTYL